MRAAASPMGHHSAVVGHSPKPFAPHDWIAANGRHGVWCNLAIETEVWGEPLGTSVYGMPNAESRSHGRRCIR